jgi:flagellar assembly protein FliH
MSSSSSAAAETFEFAPLLAGAAGGAGTAAERAAEIVALAKAEAEAISTEAARRGYDEGYAAGLAAAQAQLGPAADAVAAVLAGVEAERDAFLAAAERHAVELAVQIAEKLLCGAVEVQPEAVLGVVTGALRRVAARDRIVLEVSPADFDIVRDAAEGIADRLGGVHRLEVVSERRVTRGGCVVRTEDGEVDAQLDGQLARVREVLADAVRRDPADG